MPLLPQLRSFATLLVPRICLKATGPRPLAEKVVISFGATKTELRKTVIWAAKLDRPEPGEVDSSLGLHLSPPKDFFDGIGQEEASRARILRLLRCCDAL